MTLLIFLYGISIGSFLNVCVYRIPRGESIIYPPSNCPSCKTKLKWYDNIPILSYIRLRGKCRSCGEKISIQYPIIEASNGIIYILMFLRFGLSVDFLFLSLISSVLIVICFIDLFDMLIHDALIVTIIILEIFHKLGLYIWNIRSVSLWDSILGLFISGLIFFLIVIISRGGMGHGDITLISSLGFILGLRLIILNIFLSFFIGAIISVFLLISKIKSRKDAIPFGPFIIIAFFITLFYGTSILDWYFNLLY